MLGAYVVAVSLVRVEAVEERGIPASGDGHGSSGVLGLVCEGEHRANSS